MKQDRQVLMVTQKETDNTNRDDEGLYETGTIGTILQMLKLPDGTVKALVEGGKRARIDLFRQTDPFLEADVEPVIETGMTDKDPEVVVRALMSQFESYVKLNRKIPPEVVSSAGQISDPGRLADLIGAHLSIKIDEKQKLLDTVSVQSRIEMVYAHMDGEIGVLQVEKRLRTRVKRQMERSHREFYLNEQMKAIQKELTESEDGASGELVELEKKINQTRLTKEAKEKALGELKKLKMMPPMAAEATVIRNYLDWMVSIPWKKQTKVKRDLHAAQAILDHDHYGLDKVKDRIMEYLAVQQRTGRVKGSILCLVGPPGVGKTSLGQSVARATNRHFVRVALGGVRDESEIRGHRRTYIGSQPGKIVQGMKKAKSSNPLFLLDEIDKMASDWRGDPASALLEVLDPEQNHTFNDHYLEVDYDLSDVMFICTANSLDMPSPLLDRMEIIRYLGIQKTRKLKSLNVIYYINKLKQAD
jgi:ATP-dependent Lon protease